MLFVADFVVALHREDILVTNFSLIEIEDELYLCFGVSQVLENSGMILAIQSRFDLLLGVIWKECTGEED